MRIEFLGTGGAVTTPRPGCDCRVCRTARQRGVPDSRTGPSIFVHGPDILFDTPEESKAQLERAGIRRINACFYSHWHPDHTMGRRVWETRNLDLLDWRSLARATDIYLPAGVAASFHHRLGLSEHFRFMQSQGYVRVVELPDGAMVELDGVAIRPIRLAEEYVYAFELRQDDRRALVVMDELFGWTPPAELRGVDVAILPMGFVEHHPLTGERRVASDFPALARESRLADTLAVATALDARRTLLTHIEEPFGLTHDDLEDLARRLHQSGHPIEFAWDTLTLDL